MTEPFCFGVVVGWFAGAVSTVLLWRWRGMALLRRQGQEIRRLRAALEDSTAKEAGQFASAEKMARMLAEQAGRGMKR
jgi:hypothetical protein